MTKLPLTMLRAFAAVYDAGGIRPAARRLEVAHTSVLRSVRDLEAMLGVALVDHRGARHALAFTAAGEALGKATIASFAALEAAVAAIAESHHRNTVTVETTPSFAARWLLPRLGRLEDALGRIELSIVVEQRLRPPGESGCDIAIRLGRGPWPGLDCVPLLDDFLYPVASPAYWRAQGGGDDPASLSRCRLLHDRDPGAAWGMWLAAHGPADLDVRRGARFASADLVLKAAEQGLGVALSRGSLAADSELLGTLVAPFGSRRVALPRSVWLVLPEGRPRRAAVAAVCDWLVAEASGG